MKKILIGTAIVLLSALSNVAFAACDIGFAGLNCDSCDTNYYNYPSCTFAIASVTCSGNGTVNALGSCDCDGGWSSSNCGVNDDGPTDPYYDDGDNNVVAVSEPSITILLGIGLTVLGLVRRKRKL